MAKLLYKFSTAEGALAILKYNSVFVTSPLDLNDPFEMRPAWTNEHECRARLNRERLSQMMEGSPILLCTESGLVDSGQRLPFSEPESPIDVEYKRGLADDQNARVFEHLHARYRVLSLVTNLMPDEADPRADITAILMWSHYADQFKGICIILDPESFYNGIQPSGYPVKYSEFRLSLPPEEYDTVFKILSPPTQGGNIVDRASGLELSPEEKASLDQHRYIQILTHKSSAWEYESEVRMIYDLPTLRHGGKHKDIWQACQACKAQGKQVDACSNKLLRDAVVIPADAIRGVIFGANCQASATKDLLQTLAEPRYAHVELYWSSLHSDKYTRGEPDYIQFTQDKNTTEIARVKSHHR